MKKRLFTRGIALGLAAVMLAVSLLLGLVRRERA